MNKSHSVLFWVRPSLFLSGGFFYSPNQDNLQILALSYFNLTFVTHKNNKMDRVAPEIFTFLNQLKKNNNREWFQENKPTFTSVQEEAKSFFQSIANEMDFDQLEPIKVFRIYRDVRFSKDKRPYKTHFGANYMRSSARRRGSYYLHLEPGNSFCAVGFYAPEKDDLLRIRKEFELDDEPMRQILEDLSSVFPDGLSGDELKTAPRNFDKDHPAIDLIRKKQFYLMHTYTDKQVLAKSFIDKVVKTFHATIPFLDYMSEVLTTDLNGESIL